MYIPIWLIIIIVICFFLGETGFYLLLGGAILCGAIWLIWHVILPILGIGTFLVIENFEEIACILGILGLFGAIGALLYRGWTAGLKRLNTRTNEEDARIFMSMFGAIIFVFLVLIFRICFY